MKKSTPKLSLRTQTIRLLTSEALHHAGGGNEPVATGFVMKDTIIIRTSGFAAAPTEGCR